jgi:hypothetical protein
MNTENHRPLYLMCTVYSQQNGHHGHVHMVVGFTTTHVISAYHHWNCEFEQHVIYVCTDSRYSTTGLTDIYIIGRCEMVPIRSLMHEQG